MFHVYVGTACGKAVDIGRTQFLMDRELARLTAAWVAENETLPASRQPAGQPLTQDIRDQAFWDHYCERHREKYGKPFEPDVNPDWGG